MPFCRSCSKPISTGDALRTGGYCDAHYLEMHRIHRLKWWASALQWIVVPVLFYAFMFLTLWFFGI